MQNGKVMIAKWGKQPARWYYGKWTNGWKTKQSFKVRNKQNKNQELIQVKEKLAQAEQQLNQTQQQLEKEKESNSNKISLLWLIPEILITSGITVLVFWMPNTLNQCYQNK